MQRLPSFTLVGCLCTLSLMMVACGHHFELTAPNRFVELEDQHQYALRATTPDGVVMAVREIDNDPYGDLGFWVDALSNNLRLAEGYALIDTAEVRAATGEVGRQLRFGRDEGEQPYLYWTTLFVTTDYIFVIEAGGRQDLFETVQPSIEQAITSFRID